MENDIDLKFSALTPLDHIQIRDFSFSEKVIPRASILEILPPHADLAQISSIALVTY